MTHTKCQICGSKNFRYPFSMHPHPYTECQDCGFYFQIEQKPKVYEAFHEASGDTMSDHEKIINHDLAKQLYSSLLIDKLASHPLSALDIGAKFPWFMHSLANISNGLVETWAIDGIPEIEIFCQKYNLKVNGRTCDFEETYRSQKPWPWAMRKFDLITMVHMIEHLYHPIESLIQIHNLLTKNGYLFIRCPASDVQGIERDYTPGHFDIHPQVWNKRSLEKMASIVGFKIVYNNDLLPGQRDLILTKDDK